MSQWIFSLTPIVITHLTVDGYVLALFFFLARLALTQNTCSNVVDIGSDRKTISILKPFSRVRMDRTRAPRNRRTLQQAF
jgi:hypothetical protein